MSTGRLRLAVALSTWLSASVCASLVWGLAQPATATPTLYRLVGIGFLPMDKQPPDPSASFALDVNDAGVVVGQSTTSIGALPELATGDFHAVRFSEAGGLVDLGDLPGGGDTSAATGINTSGVIVGRGDGQRDPGGLPPDLSDATHATRWPDPSTIQDIGVGTQFSAAHAINDLGHVVGAVGPTSSRQGFYWTADGGMTTLANPAGALQVTAEDLNDSGWIVGHATLTGGVRAFLWDGGGGAPLDLGDLDGDGGESWALGINGSGWIVGSSDQGGEQRAFRRDPATGLLEGLPHLPGGDFSRARDVNASGAVVGSAWDPLTQSFHAVLWDADGSVYDLHDLIFGDTGWTLEEALAISDTGFIVGQARNASGQYEGFLLVPIPEPASAVLLALGLAGLARGRRRPAERGPAPRRGEPSC